VRMNHLATPGHVCDEHQNENGIEKHRSERRFRAEVEKSVNDISNVAGDENSPTAIIRQVPIEDRD